MCLISHLLRPFVVEGLGYLTTACPISCVFCIAVQYCCALHQQLVMLAQNITYAITTWVIKGTERLNCHLPSIFCQVQVVNCAPMCTNMHFVGALHQQSTHPESWCSWCKTRWKADKNDVSCTNMHQHWCILVLDKTEPELLLLGTLHCLGMDGPSTT